MKTLKMEYPKKCQRYVSSRTIQEKMEVSGKTVRAWARRYEWRLQKINSRVIRYCAEDVERSLNLDLG
jgi:uncharacterized protein YjcR